MAMGGRVGDTGGRMRGSEDGAAEGLLGGEFGRAEGEKVGTEAGGMAWGDTGWDCREFWGLSGILCMSHIVGSEVGHGPPEA